MPTAIATAVKSPRHPVKIYFRDDAAPIDGELQVQALLFTEGDFVDGNGNEGSYRRSDLEEIVESTIAYFASGDTIHVFDQGHDLSEPYQASNIVGELLGQSLQVETINAETLPDERLTDLIGKAGIFGEIALRNDDVIKRYQSKLLKQISIGFDPSGQFTNGHENAIFEVSIVPWGAVRGAMLFNKLQELEYRQWLDKNNQLHVRVSPVKPQVFALTLDGAVSEMNARYTPESDALNDLLWMLESVVISIQGTDEAELIGRDRNQLISQAITDFSSKAREVLGVGREAPPQVVVSKPKMMSETPALDPAEVKNATATLEVIQPDPEIEDLKRRIGALETANQALETRATNAETELEEQKQLADIGEKVTAAKEKAQKLVALGKMTPAKFKELFPTESTRSTALRFSKDVEGNKFSGATGLIRLEAALEAYEDAEPVVQFGKRISRDSSLANPDFDDGGELSESRKAQIKAAAKQAAGTKAY